MKAAGKQGFITNYFKQELVGDQIHSVATDRTVLFINNEHDFFRLYFFSTDPVDLGETLEKLEVDKDLVADYLYKLVDERVFACFLQSGFKKLALSRRMIHSQLPPRKTETQPEFAELSDADRIHEDLFRTFNRFTDHLPTKERLLHYISNRQVLVNRTQGAVVGVIIFQIIGRRVNFNYLYNSSQNNMDLLRLQSSFFELMNQCGIRDAFLWVDSMNERVARMYEKLGWCFDGLNDCFFLKSRKF